MTNTPITDADLHTLREMCEAATPGPWADAGRPPCVVTNPPGPDHDVVVWGQDSNVAGQHDNWRDLTFIAAARNALPGLLDEIARLRRELVNSVEDVELHKYLLSGLGYSLQWEEDQPVIECDTCGFPLGEGHAHDCTSEARPERDEIERLRGENAELRDQLLAEQSATDIVKDLMDMEDE